MTKVIEKIHPVEVKLLQLCNDTINEGELKELKERSIQAVTDNSNMADVLEDLLSYGPSFYELGLGTLFAGGYIGGTASKDMLQDYLVGFSAHIKGNKNLSGEAKEIVFASILEVFSDLLGSEYE